MFVSPLRNQISSWMIDFRWTFLVVSERKPLSQIESHLVAENAESAGAGAVVPSDAVIEDVPEKSLVGLHTRINPFSIAL